MCSDPKAGRVPKCKIQCSIGTLAGRYARASLPFSSNESRYCSKALTLMCQVAPSIGSSYAYEIPAVEYLTMLFGNIAAGYQNGAILAQFFLL